jgi:hypothetical protein
MRTLRKILAELRVLPRASRNRTDLLRYLIRRPALLAAVGVYETGLLLSSRAETRLKMLAGIRASSLVGCPF